MNDNLKYLRNEKKQKGDSEEANQNVEKMAIDNEKEELLAKTQQADEEQPSD